jgi:hypothetical protein
LRISLASHGACPEEGLSSLKDHAVVYLKELINKQPRAIRALLPTVSVLKHPLVILILDHALLTRKLSVVKEDVTVGQSADKDLLLAFKSVHLVQLGSVNEFELDT